ncbi:MAG: saccharopine dehydrogenase NADP-binding domain-containing protein [Alphaproteobacteria bacterium]|nr:saccharopine dehydrogenase NADP-binding domain-containing protein [Alphaproteobacteria bacterium]
MAKTVSKIILLGGGKIGAAIVELLGASGDYDLVVGDHDQTILDTLHRHDAERRVLDVEDAAALRDIMAGGDVVISALPFYLNAGVAEAARECGLHYFDLTEDVETTRRVHQIADGADRVFMPQCGLAPGFISIVAHDLARRFDSLDAVRLRVGALPQFPTNALNYNLTWSTDGLINEYCNPCEAIHEGKRIETLPLQGIEQFSLDGITYEAFNTSGGLGTLCETLDGKVREVDYKTVRYPGHCMQMRLLVNDLKLGERRALFKDVLETAIPITLQDVVLIFATVTGMRDGRLTQESYANKVYNRDINGTVWSAIQTTTSAGVCAMIELLRAGQLPKGGFVRQEDVTLDAFLSNRFGRYYE